MDKSRPMLTRATVVLALSVCTATASAEEPRDFIADAMIFYRVVSCGVTEALPATLDAKTIDAHCVEMAKRYTDIKKRYFDPAAKFFGTVRPTGLPTTVVYPFGGGDLLSA